MIRGIILILIDCLRADHVSSNGYHRETTPTIDDLARRGAAWTNAYSTCSWTKPSVASILTGLYPWQHGVNQGIKRSKGRTGPTTDVLSPETTTLAEAFTAAGRRCAAFLNNIQLGEYAGFSRGFEVYDPDAGRADRILSRLDDWLRHLNGAPFFAYLHLLETHWPYKPRRRHVAQFGGNRDTNRFCGFSARDYARLRRAVSRGETSLSPQDLQEMIQMYDAAVRRVDGKIKLLHRVLETHGLNDSTLLTISADHGEEFLEHGDLGHGHTLYKEVTHVPLVMKWPGGPQNCRHDTPVSLVDLPATLLALTGTSHTLPGRNLLAEAAPSSPAFTELRVRNRFLQAIRIGDWRLHRRIKYDAAAHANPPEPFGDFRSNDASGFTTVELFNLASDPKEQVNLADDGRYGSQSAGLLKEMESCLAGSERPPKTPQPTEAILDEIVVQRLRALGYIE